MTFFARGDSGDDPRQQFTDADFGGAVPKYAQPCKRRAGGDIHWCDMHESVFPESGPLEWPACYFSIVVMHAADFANQPNAGNAIVLQTSILAWMMHHVELKG